MLTSFLVITPHPSFGELIRQSLEDTGSYRVRVVDSRPDALTVAREDKPEMAFLDLDLGQQSVVNIGKDLRRVRADISLVIMAAEDKLPSSLDEIRPWRLLPKPFYLPDLLRLVGEPVQEQQERAVDPSPLAEDVAWLEDVNKAAQHLTRLTLESSAQAALITRENKLWAYAGGLSHEAADEIAAAIARYWDTQKESDLLRFIRLESTRAEHMLYATRLKASIIMALVFDAETPFSTIRSQANRLAQALSISSEQPAKPLQANIAPVPSEAAPAEPENLFDDLPPADDEDGVEIPSISSILYDVPPPRPSAPEEKPVISASPMKRSLLIEEKNEQEAEIEYPASTLKDYSPAATQRSTTFSLESSPAVPLHGLIYTERKPEMLAETQRSSSAQEDLDATTPSKAQRPSTPVAAPAGDELGETQPSIPPEGARRIVLEPPSPGLYNLTYACLLVPRISGHYLAGDLAQYLSEWMQEICIAFGWRLEFLTVRPEYLQWVVNVPPSSSPGYLMRIIRQQTSERIFAHFPRLKQENPSGDFWAPGYLIMGGDRPHPPQLVKDYINQTRQRQGIPRLRSRR